MREERNNRVPILDPIPGEFAPAICLDPPSEAEVWHKVPKFKNGCPPFYETQRNNVRILIEKIGEKIDPCKIYPLAGPCQLVHCHYKCTVYYDELVLVGLPDPVQPRRSQGRGRLHRQGPPPPLRRPARGRYAPALIDPATHDHAATGRPHRRPAGFHSRLERLEPSDADPARNPTRMRPTARSDGDPSPPVFFVLSSFSCIRDRLHRPRPDTASDRSMAEEREDAQQLLPRGLGAVLADLERLGVLDGLALLRAQELDSFVAEPVGQRAVAAGRPLAGPVQPGRLVLGDLVEVAEEPGVPLVELRLEGVDRRRPSGRAPGRSARRRRARTGSAS